MNGIFYFILRSDFFRYIIKMIIIFVSHFL